MDPTVGSSPMDVDDRGRVPGATCDSSGLSQVEAHVGEAAAASEFSKTTALVPCSDDVAALSTGDSSLVYGSHDQASGAAVSSGVTSLAAMPTDVIEKIFFLMEFPTPNEKAEMPLYEDKTRLSDERLARDDRNMGAMGLALTCRRFMSIFGRNLRAIELTTRFRFGTGSDAETACIISIAGENLRYLKIDDLKHVGARTMAALSSRCPNLRILELASVPGVFPEDLARAIARSGKNLLALSLSHMHMGDYVLEAIATHCPNIQDLRLIELESMVSEGALRPALARMASQLRRLSISSLFGSQCGLSWQVLVPPANDGPLYPFLEHLELTTLGWLNAESIVLLCGELHPHTPNLKRLIVAPRPSDGEFLSPQQFAEVKRYYDVFGHLTQFESPRRVPQFGFDKFPRSSRYSSPSRQTHDAWSHIVVGSSSGPSGVGS